MLAAQYTMEWASRLDRLSTRRPLSGIFLAITGSERTRLRGDTGSLKYLLNWSHRISGQRDVDHLRDRVRLYLQVMLIIDIFAYGSDYVSPLLIDDLIMPEYPALSTALRWAVTALVATGWAFARFARPNVVTLVALEGAVTIGLAFVYVHLAAAHATADLASFAPLFTMFGIMLVLGVRASLVPSPVLRTMVIGIVSVLCLFVVAHDAIQELDPLVLDGLIFIGIAAVISSSVTSHVIYGLRREVSEALQLGQYTLEEKLGEGGMGAVYRARHAMLQRPAAIKLIRPELSVGGAQRTRAVERFEREALVTANLKSPHTIQLYDFGVSAEGAFYYVMELLDGIDLETAVARYGPMPSERVAYVLKQVCDSLEEAHAVGLVHRDVKPANIVLCRYGIHFDFVKVLDFGLVSLAPQLEESAQRLTAEGLIGGTPAYLAPEMVAQSSDIDGRADLYGVGCVAYWLLTGHPPFERETPMATVLAHVNDEATPPSSMSELSIPKELDAIVLECLAKSPSDRPASAAELSRRLGAATGVDGWSQERASRWWNMHRPARTTASESNRQDAAGLITKMRR
jgi:serine/threonine-protein kinase